MLALNQPTSPTPNFAPLLGLKLAAKQKAEDKSIMIRADWPSRDKAVLENEDEAVWRNQVLLWELMFGMIEGRALGRRGRNGGWRWVPLPTRTDEPVYGYNLIGFYSDNIKAKWTQSRPDIVWRPASDTDQQQGAAKAATRIHDYYDRKLYTQNFRQNEAGLAQCGKYARYYFVSDKRKRKARKPILEESEVSIGDDTFFCPDCGESGLVSQLGQSPDGQGIETGDPTMDMGADMGAIGGQDAADFDMGSPDGLPGAPESPLPGSAMPPEMAGPAAGNRGGMPGSPIGDQPLPEEGEGDFSPEEMPYGQGMPDQFGSDLAPMEPAQRDQLSKLSDIESLLGGLDNLEGMPPDEDGEMPVDPGSSMMMGDEMGAMGDMGDMGAPAQVCPFCSSPNLDIQQSEKIPVTNVVGHEEYEIGDLDCETVPAFELRHDLGYDPQDSPYLIRRRRVRRDVLQSAFPHVQVSGDRGEDPGARAQEDLKTATFGSPGPFRSVRDTSAPVCDFVQIWRDPCMYSQLVLEEEMKTVDGMTIPAGTKMIDLFPTGMYQAWIEGIDSPVEWRDEHHKDYWVGSVYSMRAISALGKGLEDMVDAQRQYNLILSIIYTQLRTSALPATLFEQKLLPGGVSAYIGSLSNIPVDSTVLEGKRLSDAVHQLTPQPPTQQHFGFATNLDVVMQKLSRVTDVGLGQALGLDNSTATGAQLASANAQSLFAPQLALKAEVDRRGAEIILRLFRENTPDEVYMALAGKRGRQDGVWMSAAELCVDLFAEVRFESYLPQTNLERRQRWSELLLMIGGIPGIKALQQQAPQLLEQLAELHDVDLGSEDYTAAAEICFMRIEQMRSGEEMVAEYVQTIPPTDIVMDPMTGGPVEVPTDPMAEAGQILLDSLDPKIEAEEMGHLQAISYYRSWLTEDAGLEASEILRAGVKACIAAHLEGMMRESQLMAAMGMMAAPEAPGPIQPPGPSGGGQPGPKKKGDSPNAPPPGQ